jgi:kelch-like protein 10
MENRCRKSKRRHAVSLESQQQLIATIAFHTDTEATTSTTTTTEEGRDPFSCENIVIPSGTWCSECRDRAGEETSVYVDEELLKSKIFQAPTSEDYCNKSPFAILNFLRVHNETCDGIVITPDGGRFPVHRAVVSVISPMFHSLFMTKKDGTPPGKTPSHVHLISQPRGLGPPGPPTEVTVQGITKDQMQLIVDFIYTNGCDLTEQNVEELVPIADKFQITALKRTCCDFLANCLRPFNAIGVWKFAERNNLPDLKAAAKKFILDNFLAVCSVSHREVEFRRLDYRRIEELLYDDYLNARSEEFVFEVLIKWIQFDVDTRRRCLLDLLSTIRFGQMSYKFLTEQVWRHPLISENETCQAALYQPSIFLAEAESKLGFEIDLNDPLARPRIPYEVLFAVGGWSAGAPTNFIETYDTRADRWFLTVCEEAPPSSYHGLVAMDGKLYMAGGFDGNTHFSSLRCYDPVDRRWTDRACMYYPRCYVSVCVLDGKIYAVGGYDGRTRMRSVERYTPETNQWEMVQPMHRQRSDASACSARGKVYVAGGFNGQEVLNSVEFFDPTVNEWNFTRPMSNPRSGVSLVNYRDSLLVLGGFNGFVRMNSAERYDFETGHWNEVAEMKTARSNFAAAIVEDLVFVVGGFNGTTTISLVECYDAVSNRWYDVSPMNINRSALSACVLSGMPNAKEYSYLSKAGVPSLTRIPKE